jgi:hypothetical protein
MEIVTIAQTIIKFFTMSHVLGVYVMFLLSFEFSLDASLFALLCALALTSPAYMTSGQRRVPAYALFEVNFVSRSTIVCLSSTPSLQACRLCVWNAHPLCGPCSLRG